MVTLGLSSKLMNVPVSIAKRSDIANKGTTIYSVFVTTYNGIKEKEMNKNKKIRIFKYVLLFCSIYFLLYV